MFKEMLNSVSSDTVETFDEAKAATLLREKNELQEKLTQIANEEQHRNNAKSRIEGIYSILDGLSNHPMEYNDQIVRQILECVIVESKEQIKVVFAGGLEVIAQLNAK